MDAQCISITTKQVAAVDLVDHVADVIGDAVGSAVTRKKGQILHHILCISAVVWA